MKYLPLLFLASCSWLDSGSYCYVKIEAEACESIEIEHEQADSESSKEAEVPM